MKQIYQQNVEDRPHEKKYDIGRVRCHFVQVVLQCLSQLDSKMSLGFPTSIPIPVTVKTKVCNQNSKCPILIHHLSERLKVSVQKPPSAPAVHWQTLSFTPNHRFIAFSPWIFGPSSKHCCAEGKNEDAPYNAKEAQIIAHV